MLLQEPDGHSHGGTINPPERYNFRMLCRAAVLATLWLLILSTDAHAYIDPSAGGMLVQMLLAGTAGLAVLGKLYWARIKSTLGIKSRPSVDPPESNERS